MKLATRMSALLLLLGLVFAPGAWAQTATLVGTVTDATDNQSLPGANILLLDANGAQVTGAAAGMDGQYTISGIPAGSYTVQARFVGYQDSNTDVTLSAGESRTLDITLTQAGFELNTVIVSASRRAEKALDAPASISVLSAREVSEDYGTSSVAALRNTTGVDMAQTGVDRREVVLRGFNNAFSGAAFVLTDYRQAAVPSLAVNIYSIMPNMNVDVDHIEVVRGPGSALYGAGVDAGVIHFVTKDPFTNPGTTVSISGGERSWFGFQGRHAGVVNQNFGYKVSAQYARGDDWELDPNDPEDQIQIDIDGPRNNKYEKLNVNGTLEYRANGGVSVIANGGYSALTATVLSGIGTVQADNFGYAYGQLRLIAGNFFAQFYLNRNNAGDSFVYGGDKVVDKGMLYNAQAQYDLSMANGRQQFIIGVDLELTRPDTEGTILGRNESDDAISEYGAYVQSQTALSPKLDFTVALRGDYNNINEKFQVSPRAALVFKPAAGHNVRATYNRAFSSFGVNSLFLDIVGAQVGPITVRGRGAAKGFTWERNPAFAGIAGTDLVASSLIPTSLGAPTPAGMPLDATYASVHAGIAAIPVDVLTQILQQAGLPVNEQATALLVQLLSPENTQVQGFSRGLLAIPDLSGGAPKIVSDLTDIKPLDQTVSQTVELGYKGVINNRILFAIDGYYTQKKNFVGPLLMETPTVLVPTLSNDLTGALATGIAGNQILNGLLGQLGVTPEAAAALVVGFAADDLPDATTPIAIVQPRENNPGIGQVPELMLTYRNFGNVDYYGIDASVQVQANERLNLFGNMSFVSDDFFDNKALGEDNEALAIALNAPAFKAKLGFNYAVPNSFSVNASARYTDAFPVQSGPYVGIVEDAFLIDVGAGYDFSNVAPGLRVDLGITNILDDQKRQFVGAPKIGRQAILRLTFTR